ncbi:MAG: VOC family protein [Marinilabiliaceae bacterium]
MEKLIAWVEIPSNDFDRAVKFYNSLLSMELKSESYFAGERGFQY